MLTTQKSSSARAVRSHLKSATFSRSLATFASTSWVFENQQTFITRMPARATNKTVSRKTVLNLLGTLSNDSDDGPQLGLQLLAR